MYLTNEAAHEHILEVMGFRNSVITVIISYEAFETPFEYDVLPSYSFTTPLYRATGISAESGESPQSEER